MQETKTMNSTQWGLLVLLSVLWGGAFFFVGVAVVELPPLTVVLARVGIAAAILLALTLLLGHSLPRTLSAWMPFLVMGLLNNAVPFSFLNAGQTMVSVGLASIINGMTPLFTALVMASFREERLTIYRVVGVLLGVAGVVLISRPDADMADAQLLGIGLCLAATLSYGFAALWGRRHLADVPPLKSATCQLLSSTLIMTVVVAIVDRPWTLPLPSTEVWMALGGLALFGTAIAYVVFFEILAPAIEAVVARGVRPVALRQVSPRRTGAQHPHDAVEHAPVVYTRDAARLVRQQRFDHAPLEVGQIVTVHRQAPAIWELES